MLIYTNDGTIVAKKKQLRLCDSFCFSVSVSPFPQEHRRGKMRHDRTCDEDRVRSGKKMPARVRFDTTQ